MQTLILFSAFIAVWIGCVLLTRQNLRLHFGGSAQPTTASQANFRVFSWVWFAIATAVAITGMLLPSLRLPPLAVPALVAGLSAFYAIVLWRFSRSASASVAQNWRGALALQQWRAYFGALILLGAPLGLLPWSFALVAGLGDIAVGLWAMWLHRLVRKEGASLSMPTVLAFSAVGVADLINAGRLGGAVVLPWLIERQMPGFILLLPAFGVPIMMVTHFWMLRGYFRSRNALTLSTA